MYFLVKDDKKANFDINNVDAWKYPTFSNFDSFLKPQGGVFAPLPPYGASPASLSG